MKFLATPTGSRYHREHCPHVDHAAQEYRGVEVFHVRPGEIRAANLQPCLECKPPPIPTVVAALP